MRRTAAVLVFASVLSLPSLATAQEDRSSFLAEALKQVVFDPTTFAPAAIAYDATIRDWNTSQVFFANGHFERNPRFTLSGLPNSRPLGYEAGRQVILKDALVHLQLSALHNFTTRVLERRLIDEFPERRKLIRVIGWVERIAFASLLSHHLSAQHYQQASQNERLAAQYGFR